MDDPRPAQGIGLDCLDPVLQITLIIAGESGYPVEDLGQHGQVSGQVDVHLQPLAQLGRRGQLAGPALVHLGQDMLVDELPHGLGIQVLPLHQRDAEAVQALANRRGEVAGRLAHHEHTQVGASVDAGQADQGQSPAGEEGGDEEGLEAWAGGLQPGADPGGVTLDQQTEAQVLGASSGLPQTGYHAAQEVE